MRAFLLACALLVPPAEAATCTVSSGALRNTLLELYTSEGCSSCPPADRWLSQLPASPRVVPLAFHVDYWDRLGWRDRFGQAAFSQRQRVRNSGAGWVYTPQVMLDGEDFRAWRRGVPRAAAVPAQLALDLSLNPIPGKLAVAVTPHFSTPANNARLYLALTESRLSSQVTAGENSRRTLHHDHVVRELVGPLRLEATRHQFDLEADWKTENLRIAAFVIDERGGTLQAVSGGCPS